MTLGLHMLFTWIDDGLRVGNKVDVLHSKEEMKVMLQCNEVGELTGFVGYKLDCDKEHQSIKFTQTIAVAQSGRIQFAEFQHASNYYLQMP